MDMIFIYFILGLGVGSFLNAFIFRMREGKSVWRGRSQCPRCQKTLRWFELIPIFSFILQGGRCRSCQIRISWQYPLVELATGILFLTAPFQFSIINFQFSITLINLLVYWFIISVLMAIFVYDLKYGEIPDQLSLPAIVLLLSLSILNHLKLINLTLIGNWELGIGNLSAGILIGGGFFALQYFISRGRWIGGGDIRLGILMGAILGWPKILIALFIAYVGGAIICLFLVLIKKKTLKSAVPFGVFLVPATLIALFWGGRILTCFNSPLLLLPVF